MILTHHLSIFSKQNTRNSCTSAYISVDMDVGVSNVVGVDLGLWVGSVVGVSIVVDEYVKKKDQRHHTKILTCC